MRDSQRLFLRSLVSKQFLSEGEAKDVYQKACDAYGDDNSVENFLTFMETVNKNLRPLFMEIRRGISEDDGAIYYGLVNTTEDEHSKMATDFSPNDIAFFKRAMDLIVAAPDGTVSSLDAINAAADLEKKMSITRAEVLITKLVQEKWMSESSGAYSLGPRAMLELHPYLKRVYDDEIIDCMMCHEITIKGQRCNQCEGKIHKHCAARYFRGRSQKLCPNQRCGAVWVHEIPQLTTTAGAVSSQPCAGSSGHSKRKKR